MDRRVDVIARHAVIDTCAVWNVLSSPTLHLACRNAQFFYALTGFVLYECLSKPRSTAKASDRILQDRLRRARSAGEFTEVTLTVDDLQEVAQLEARRRLSKGELSSIAFARRAAIAFQTDDQKARRLAATALPAEHVQTTPHVLGWLFYERRLIDGDLDLVVREHAECDGILTRYFEQMHQEALRCRLMGREPSTG
jgi:hypothetical protein